MIVNTSALIAIIRSESDSHILTNTLLNSAERPRMSAASYLEIAIVVDGKCDPILSRAFDALIDEFEIEIEPVTFDQARIARADYRDYGKGSGHPAQLNFGDCFSYALASQMDAPLLFIGNDFTQTDLVAA